MRMPLCVNRRAGNHPMKGATMKVNTLRPGILVNLSTSMRGNVRYRKQDIETDHLVDDKTRRARWETERTISDAQEFERASAVRSAAVYTVARLCVPMPFGGYLCPDTDNGSAAALDAAIDAARAMVAEFNAGANITNLGFYVACWKVAADDAQAIRELRAELNNVVADMESGIANLSPDQVRNAAKRAQEIAELLTEQSQAKVSDAVEAARKAARSIAKAIKAGEVAALEIDKAVLARVANARTAFLDVDEAPAPEFQAPVVAPRALDMDVAPVDEAPAFAAPALFDVSVDVNGNVELTQAPAMVAAPSRDIDIG